MVSLISLIHIGFPPSNSVFFRGFAVLLLILKFYPMYVPILS